MNDIEMPIESAEQELELAYSEQAILDKLTAYALNPQKIFSNIKTNFGALRQAELAEKSSENAFLQRLHTEIKNWQPSENLNNFTANINQLVFNWLNAIQDGASTQSVLKYLKCLELKSTFGLSSSSKLHCFLFDLLAETSQQHQQLQLHYVLNYDANTQLPNAGQVAINLEKTIAAASDHQLIGLLSVHFQLSKSNPNSPHVATASLSKKIALHIMPSGNFALSSINKDAAVKSYPNAFALLGGIKIKL